MSIIYANTIRDSKSNSVHPNDEYFICKQINDKWHIIQSERTAKDALRYKEVLADHDLINGHITDSNCYRVFMKELSEIRYKL